MASYVPTKSSTRPYIPSSRRVRARSSASYSSSSSLSSDDASTSSPTSPASSGPSTPSTSILHSTSSIISTAAVRQYTKKDLPDGHPLGDSATSKEAFMKEKRYFPLLEEVEDDHWKDKPWTHPLYLGEQFDFREIRGTCGKKVSRSKSHKEDMARLTVNELVVTRPDIGACFRNDLKRTGMAALHVKAIGDRGQAILGNCWTSKIDGHGDRCSHDNGEVDNRAAGLAYHPPLVKKRKAKGDSKLGDYKPWTLANEKVIKPYVPGRDIDAGIAKWQLDNPPKPPKIVSTPSATNPPAKDKGKGKGKAQPTTSHSAPSQSSAAKPTRTSIRNSLRQTVNATEYITLANRPNASPAVARPSQSSPRPSSELSDDGVRIVKKRKVNVVPETRRKGATRRSEGEREEGAGTSVSAREADGEGQGQMAMTDDDDDYCELPDEDFEMEDEVIQSSVQKQGQMAMTDDDDDFEMADEVFQLNLPLRPPFPPHDKATTIACSDVAKLYARWQAQEYMVSEELIHSSARLVAGFDAQYETFCHSVHGRYNAVFDGFAKEAGRMKGEMKRREEEMLETRTQELESLRVERAEDVKEREKFKREIAAKGMERAIKAEERALKAEKKTGGLELEVVILKATLKHKAPGVNITVTCGEGAGE